ncbi:MAG TPA: hypothetical protein VD861_08365, partial [Pyrinomonadaceae bacterium]|nr:hypothetical protein [Pyrinomonadaceae bacterium]
MFRSYPARSAFVRALSLLTVFLLTQAPLSLLAQTPDSQTNPPQQGMGGASTGEARMYTSKRTVGIVDPNAPTVFEDVTARTALASFQHRSGSPQKDYIVETPSGGVAIFD